MGGGEVQGIESSRLRELGNVSRQTANDGVELHDIHPLPVAIEGSLRPCQAGVIEETDETPASFHLGVTASDPDVICRQVVAISQRARRR